MLSNLLQSGPWCRSFASLLLNHPPVGMVGSHGMFTATLQLSSSATCFMYLESIAMGYCKLDAESPTSHECESHCPFVSSSPFRKQPRPGTVASFPSLETDIHSPFNYDWGHHGSTHFFLYMITITIPHSFQCILAVVPKETPSPPPPFIATYPVSVLLPKCARPIISIAASR